MKTITGFFDVEPGNKSIMRLAFFIIIIYAIIASAFIFYMSGYVGGIATFTALTTVAFTGKIIQKSQEVKEEVKDGGEN